MSTNTSSSGTATQGLSPSATEVLAATIAGAVERQLTHYVSSMSQQVDAVRQAAAADRDQLRDELLLRLRYAANRDRHFATKRRGIPPV